MPVLFSYHYSLLILWARSSSFCFLLFCLLTRFSLSAVMSCRYVYCRHLRILNVVTTLCLWHVKTLSINHVWPLSFVNTDNALQFCVTSLQVFNRKARVRLLSLCVVRIGNFQAVHKQSCFKNPKMLPTNLFCRFSQLSFFRNAVHFSWLLWQAKKCPPCTIWLQPPGINLQDAEQEWKVTELWGILWFSNLVWVP